MPNKTSFIWFQVSSLARENERDSYRLSWGTENLDNVALSSSPIHSGCVLSGKQNKM